MQRSITLGLLSIYELPGYLLRHCTKCRFVFSTFTECSVVSLGVFNLHNVSFCILNLPKGSFCILNLHILSTPSREWVDNGSFINLGMVPCCAVGCRLMEIWLLAGYRVTECLVTGLSFVCESMHCANDVCRIRCMHIVFLHDVCRIRGIVGTTLRTHFPGLVGFQILHRTKVSVHLPHAFWSIQRSLMNC